MTQTERLSSTRSKSTTATTHHPLRGRRPDVTTRSNFALPESDQVMVDEPSAHAVFIQFATKTTVYRGRRPREATRSIFALAEDDPVRSTILLPTQSPSRSPPKPPLDNRSAS